LFKSSRYNYFSVLPGGKELLFNFLTLRLIAFEAKEAAKAHRILADPVLPPRRGEARLTQLLLRNGFLVDEGTDETAPLEREFRKSRDEERILSLTVLPTLACNFRCSYCYEDHSAPLQMSREVEDALIAFVQERLHDGGRMSVVWFGGEPLLMKKTIGTLSRAFLDLCEARRAEYSASMITNGYLLDGATAAWLKGLKVWTAQVTLDGPPEVHDLRRPLATGGKTFRMIVDNLKAAVDFLEISVRVNVDATNRDSLGRFLDHMIDEGIAAKAGIYPALTGPFTSACGHIADQCLGREEFSIVSLETSLELTRRGLSDRQFPAAQDLPCGALRRGNFIVTPSGGLAACWNRVAVPEKHIGHLLSPPTKEMDRERESWFDFDPFRLECRECLVLPICMGACAHQYFEKGQLACSGWKHHPQEHILNYYRLRVLQQQSEIVGGFKAIVKALEKSKGV
jgi:uncharacterized protein